MSSVPMSMTMAKSKGKSFQMQREMQLKMEVEQRYNNKMMNSIWGQYNKYSVHNMKSQQTESGGQLTPPVIQIMHEAEEQVERMGSPMIERLKDQEITRSRSLTHLNIPERVRTNSTSSMSELFVEEQQQERSPSPLLQIINNHRSDLRQCPSPLLSLARDHYEGSRPISPYPTNELFVPSADRGRSISPGLIGSSPSGYQLTQ